MSVRVSVKKMKAGNRENERSRQRNNANTIATELQCEYRVDQRFPLLLFGGSKAKQRHKTLFSGKASNTGKLPNRFR